MEWLESLFLEHSALQAVCVISVIIAIGLGLGKLRVCGISLGVTFVFFTGILAGHLGLSINTEILKYAEDFGLMLFIYELGLKVGPGFFSSFRSGGIKLNLLGLGLVVANNIIKRHGGRISVTSSEEAGTCFRIELPETSENMS